MKNIKVSIIVPIYNGIKYIDKCMDSLLNQTYKNIEIILSDDGSNDGSLEKIKEYAQKYKNIKYDTHNNVGLSITRNIAFEKITGDFVTYLDVDDYLDCDFIKKMIANIDDYNIIIGGYRRIYADGKLDFSYNLKNTVWNRYRRVTVWAKIYRVSFLKDNNIIFPNEKIFGEDIVYTMKCLSKTDRVKIIDYIGYNNLINENSITHVNKDKIFNDVPKILININNFIENNKEFINKNKKIVYYYYLKIFVAYLVEQSNFLDINKLNEYYKTSFSIIKNIFKKYKYKIHFCFQKSELFKINLIINIFILFEKLHISKTLIKILNKVYYHE